MICRDVFATRCSKLAILVYEAVVCFGSSLLDYSMNMLRTTVDDVSPVEGDCFGVG